MFATRPRQLLDQLKFTAIDAPEAGGAPERRARKPAPEPGARGIAFSEIAPAIRGRVVESGTELVERGRGNDSTPGADDVVGGVRLRQALLLRDDAADPEPGALSRIPVVAHAIGARLAGVIFQFDDVKLLVGGGRHVSVQLRKRGVHDVAGGTVEPFESAEEKEASGNQPSAKRRAEPFHVERRFRRRESRRGVP